MFFQKYKLELFLDGSAGLQAAVAAAMQAAPAVSKLTADVTRITADVTQNTADIARISAVCQNLQLLWMNERHARAGRAMTPLLKTVAGHPAPPVAGVPRDPALLALAGAGAPVPVGAELPALSFAPAGAWTHTQIMSLTHAQLDDLEWFYNPRFEGISIGIRGEKFLTFLGGL